MNWLSETDLSDMLSTVRDLEDGSRRVANRIRDSISDMLSSVKEQVGSQRRARLFACACLRRVWDLLQVEGARRIVELAEAYADGEASAADLQAANDPAFFADVDARYWGRAEPRLSYRAGEAVTAAQWLASPTFNIRDACAVASNTSKEPDHDFFCEPHWEPGLPGGLPHCAAERAEQVKILWDIFGNPFNPVTFQPEWRTAPVLQLARLIYQSRDFSPLPILGDALEEAGCDSEVVLNHCRSDGPHVRGCFVVDLSLGKE